MKIRKEKIQIDKIVFLQKINYDVNKDLTDKIANEEDD